MQLNLLGISGYGSSGVEVGNLISRELSNHGLGFTQFDGVTKKITVLNSSDTPQPELSKILLESPASQHWAWYPIVDKERDEKGNLEICLCAKEKSYKYRVVEEKIDCKENIRKP